VLRARLLVGATGALDGGCIRTGGVDTREARRA